VLPLPCGAWKGEADIHGTIPHRIREQREIERMLMRGDARLCVSLYGEILKLIFPHKTSAELAALLGGSTRAWDYEIAGEREPSPDGMVFIQKAILDNYKANKAAKK
jgi:hypothetical protein